MDVVYYLGCQRARHTRECKRERQMIIDKRRVKAKVKAIKYKPQVKRRKPLPVNGKEENKTNREKNLKNF